MTVRQGAKIGFMGSGGTGKTTDAVALSEKLGVPMIKSASREAYERLGITEDDCLKLTDEDKWKLQLDIFKVKQQLDDSTFEFIADRTLLDHWAYCLMYCSAFIPKDEFYEIENQTRKHMRSTYSHIFYYPFGFWTPSQQDGTRQTAPGWQSAIDAILVGYCIRWNIPAIQVPQLEGEIDARQEFVTKHILGQTQQENK